MSMPDTVWVEDENPHTPRRAYLGAGSWPGERTEYIRADLVPQWLPIETAPKDGTRFLAYEKRDISHYPCWWNSDFQGWSGWQDDWDSEPKPTHWMPLPTPHLPQSQITDKVGT